MRASLELYNLLLSLYTAAKRGDLSLFRGINLGFIDEYNRIFGDRVDFQRGTIPKRYDEARNCCAYVLGDAHPSEQRQEELRKAKKIIDGLSIPKE